MFVTEKAEKGSGSKECEWSDSGGHTENSAEKKHRDGGGDGVARRRYSALSILSWGGCLGGV